MLRQKDKYTLIGVHGRDITPPEGYTKVTDVLYIQTLPTCIHRETSEVKRRCCGGNYSVTKCNYKGCNITRYDCYECEVSDELRRK